MDYFAISFSIFFIVMGFLVKRYPHLISGSYTMSAKKKKNVEMDKVRSVLRKGFIISGIAAGGLYCFFKFLDMPVVAMQALICIPIVTLSVAYILSLKYDHNPKNEKILPIILCIVLPLFIVGMIVYGTQHK